jgi:hypothetical protein
MVRRSLQLPLALLGTAIGCAPPDAAPGDSAALRRPPAVSFRLDSAISAAPACGAAVATPPAAATLPPLAGTYLLTLVATDGSRRGATAHGRLWLARTSARDRSPGNGRGPARPDTASTPYVGATDLDFATVGAPMDWADTVNIPRPTSRDPIYPGVLAKVRPPPDSAGASTAWPFFLVGTLHNTRDESGWVDGPGIVLVVQAAGPASLVGRWGPWGRKVDGRGYFCLRRVRGTAPGAA